jgi:DNA polymerase-3 subunit alpha
LPIIRYGGDLLSAWQEGESKELSEMGYIKFDLLGLKTLSILKDTENLSRTSCYDYPLDDESVYREFRANNLSGVFQFDAWAAGDVIKKIKPTGFEDLIAAGALCRPGPRDVGMDKVYAARKTGRERYKLTHPAVQEVLGYTYGVITYQEQMTELASKLANMSLADAEKLRKDIVKKSEQVKMHRDEELLSLEKKFVGGAVNNGMKAADANILWQQILSFARYGFNRSHSCAYAFISYWCMYQKVHFPAEFLTSCLKYAADKDAQWKLITEAKRLGIRIKRVDINNSDIDYTLDNGSIRFGLSTVSYLGITGIEEILAKRPFSSRDDFRSRVAARKCNSRAFTNLEEAGAFNRLSE